MGSLLVVTGPPGAGKSTVARVLADAESRSVLIEGDAFFRFLARGAIEPWLPESDNQNTVVIRAAGSAAGVFAMGEYATVYDGVVGPWSLPTFGAATRLDRLDYVVLLPAVDVCVQRLARRRDHDFRDEAAARKMHAEFDRAVIDGRHVLRDPPAESAAVAQLVKSAQKAGQLTCDSLSGQDGAGAGWLAVRRRDARLSTYCEPAATRTAARGSRSSTSWSSSSGSRMS